MIEITRDNIDIEQYDDLYVDPCDEGYVICAWLSTYFDVDEKFGTHTMDNDDTWVNLLAMYYPTTQKLEVVYIVDGISENREEDYIPTENEKKEILEVIRRAVKEQENISLEDFIKKYCSD